MYRKPTEKELAYAIAEGELEEIGDAERRGYAVTVHGSMNCEEIQRISACYYEDPQPDDEDCAIEAERSGFCKIIPISELPENFKTEWGGDARWFGWIDTPENRKAIADYAKIYC